MIGLNLLIELLNTKTIAVNEEINSLKKKQEITSLKIKISTQLQNDYHKVILCQDEEIYKLIEEKAIATNFEDYKSMKFIISNEEKLSLSPQYKMAKEEANLFISNLNNNSLEEYQQRINSLIEILSKIKDIINNLENNKPILEIEFILNFITSSKINTQDKVKIISHLITYNNQAFKNDELQRLVSKNKEVEEKLSETLKEQLSKKTEPTDQSNEEYQLNEKVKKAFSSANKIIKNNELLKTELNTPEMNGHFWKEINPYAQLVSKLKDDISACIELLMDKALEDKQSVLKEQDKLINNLYKTIEIYQKQYDIFIQKYYNLEQLPSTNQKQYEDENAKNIIIFFRKNPQSKFLIEEDLEQNQADKTDYFNLEKILKTFNDIESWNFDQQKFHGFQSSIRDKHSKDYIIESKLSGKKYNFLRAKCPVQKKGEDNNTRVSFIKINLCEENKNKLNLRINNIILIIGEINISNHNTNSEYSAFIKQYEENKEQIEQVIQLLKNPNTPVETLYKLLNDSSDLYNYFRDNSNGFGR